MQKVDVTRFAGSAAAASLMRRLWLAGSPCQANARSAYDRQASLALGRADYDFTRIASSVRWGERAFFWSRQKALDGAVARFCESRPGGVVVSLGCGLSTAEFRGGRRQCLWINVDAPGVIALRGALLPQSGTSLSVPRSLLDPRWMDELPLAGGRPVLFVADGVLSRMPTGLAKALVVLLAGRFPGARLCFDALSRPARAVAFLASGRRLSASPRHAFCAEQTESLKDLSPCIGGVASLPLALPACSYSFGEKVCLGVARRLGLVKCFAVDFRDVRGGTRHGR